MILVCDMAFGVPAGVSPLPPLSPLMVLPLFVVFKKLIACVRGI